MAEWVLPASGAGPQQTFTFRYASAADIYGIAQSFGGATGTCLTGVLPAANLLALYDDAGATVLGTATLGSSVVLENSSCRVAAAGASVSLTGTDVTVVLPYTFTAAFSGGKTLYAWASSMAGVYSSTLEGGDWLARSQVTGVAPTPVGVGQALTITGLGFGAAPNGNGVAINGTAAPGVQSWSDTQIVVTVPASATTGPVTVVTNNTPSNAVAVTVLGDGPTLVSLAPPFGPAGTPVVLTGLTFGASQGTSTVTFNGIAAAVSAWSDTAITVTVPAGATSGLVLVTRNGLDSNGLPFAVGEDEVVYYHTDGIGSLRMVTDAAGQTIARHDYQPFGVEWLPPPGSQDRVRFAGTEFDPETGGSSWMPLNYVGARYLHSATGRFTSVDPGHQGAYIEQPQSWNGYAYAGNNPLRFTDPTGTDYLINAYGGTPFVFDGSFSAFRSYVTDQGFSLAGNMFHGAIKNASGEDVGIYDEWTKIDEMASGIARMAAPVAAPRSIAQFYAASALAGGGLAFAGVLGGGGLTTLGLGNVIVGATPEFIFTLGELP